jgi:hypothetical protein
MNEEMKLATAIKVGNEAIKTFIIDFPESAFRQLALRIYFEQASSFEEIAFVYRNTLLSGTIIVKRLKMT